jgi:hypothetical protein
MSEYENSVAVMNLSAWLRSVRTAKKDEKKGSKPEADNVHASFLSGELNVTGWSPEEKTKECSAEYKHSGPFTGMKGFSVPLKPIARPNKKGFKWVDPFKLIPPNLGVANQFAREFDPAMVKELVQQEIVTNNLPSVFKIRNNSSMPEKPVKYFFQGGHLKQGQTPAQYYEACAARLDRAMPCRHTDVGRLVDYCNQMATLSTREEFVSVASHVDVVQGASLGLPYVMTHQKAVFGKNDATAEAFTRAGDVLYEMAKSETKEFRNYVRNLQTTRYSESALLLKRKLDRYDVAKLGEKVRGYYVMPGHLNIAMKAFSEHFLPLFKEHPDVSTNSAYGMSWFDGGGDALAMNLVVTPILLEFETKGFYVCVRGKIYSDDGLMLVEATVNGKEFEFLVGMDYRAHDMNCSVDAALARELSVLQRGAGMFSRGGKRFFKNSAHLLKKLQYGGPVCVGQTYVYAKEYGLNSGSAATTAAGIDNNVLGWYKAEQYCAVVFQEFQLSKTPNETTVCEFLQECVRRTGFTIKVSEITPVDQREEKGYPAFLGVSLRAKRDGHWWPTPARDKMIAHAITPKSRCNAAAWTARMMGLALCGGFLHPTVFNVLDRCATQFRAIGEAAVSFGTDIISGGYQGAHERLSTLKGTMPSHEWCKRQYYSGVINPTNSDEKEALLLAEAEESDDELPDFDAAPSLNPEVKILPPTTKRTPPPPPPKKYPIKKETTPPKRVKLPRWRPKPPEPPPTSELDAKTIANDAEWQRVLDWADSNEEALEEEDQETDDELPEVSEEPTATQPMAVQPSKANQVNARTIAQDAKKREKHEKKLAHWRALKLSARKQYVAEFKEYQGKSKRMRKRTQLDNWLESTGLYFDALAEEEWEEYAMDYAMYDEEMDRYQEREERRRAQQRDQESDDPG